MAGWIPRQHYERESIRAVRLDNVKQVFVGHAAFLADQRDFVGIEDDRSAVPTAI
jgi:hypothetical protein